MKSTVTVAAVLLVAAGAQASEVFKTTDPQGRPIYTDRPQTLPAQRLDVKTSTTDTVPVFQPFFQLVLAIAPAQGVQFRRQSSLFLGLVRQLLPELPLFGRESQLAQLGEDGRQRGHAIR